MTTHRHSRDCNQRPEALAARTRIAVDWMARQMEEEQDTEEYEEAAETAEFYRATLQEHHPEYYIRFMDEEQTRVHDVLN